VVKQINDLKSPEKMVGKQAPKWEPKLKLKCLHPISVVFLAEG
jgi:hypothetical protein